MDVFGNFVVIHTKQMWVFLFQGEGASGRTDHQPQIGLRERRFDLLDIKFRLFFGFLVKAIGD